MYNCPKKIGTSLKRKVPIFYLSAFLRELQLEQHPQDEQSHPQEVLPFFFLIIDVTITDTTTATQNTIKIISSAPIIIPFYLLFSCWLI